MSPRPERLPQGAPLYPSHSMRPRGAQLQPQAAVRRPLKVFKFGGTSVGDALSIARVVDIVRTSVLASDVVVVVSAMSGVTNKLLDAASQSAEGDRHSVAATFRELRERHEEAAKSLIESVHARRVTLVRLREVLDEGERLCGDVLARRQLTLRETDAISGLGERLSAPLVAAALAAAGVDSEAIETTELVVTDGNHGGAEPFIDLTRERCEIRVRPLLLQGIVPVVTGFIGATREGALTTLGRNSSDFSGTIVGAALNADEVVLWTDVDGILSADPRLVPTARPIPQMSYQEASDLADSGAKVLHSKTLRPVMQRGITLTIRNTFAPDRPGTRIAPVGSFTAVEMRALAAAKNRSLITVRGSSRITTSEILTRSLAVVGAELPLILPSFSSRHEVSFVVSSSQGDHVLQALRSELALELANRCIGEVTLQPGVSVITVVGYQAKGASRRLSRLVRALNGQNLSVLASVASPAGSSIRLVVADEDMQAALVAVHDEFHRQSASEPRSLEPPIKRS
ncbi:MAG TPA: aspartate kinase [Candidatus Limnocylindrales bacterium]|nr:aspartate kinase [Candidatus Limnocylindrales bacterium]